MPQTKEHKGAGHRKRLRDKFLDSGLSGFHDYEVVELLLTLGTPRKDCKQAAKYLLKRFKTLQGVFEATPRELNEVQGIGSKNQLGLRLIKAISERYLNAAALHRNPINNSKELVTYLTANLRDKHRECFKVVYLDAKNSVLDMETLFRGTLTASSVYPREVVRAALDHHAAALIFAHNHPSGDPQPSKEDMAVTKQLVFACRLMGIAVHEHVIIGQDAYFSFADQGYLKRINQAYDNQAVQMSSLLR